MSLFADFAEMAKSQTRFLTFKGSVGFEFNAFLTHQFQFGSVLSKMWVLIQAHSVLFPSLNIKCVNNRIIIIIIKLLPILPYLFFVHYVCTFLCVIALYLMLYRY